MEEDTWKIQYKQWKKLKPYQIKLIDDGPKSQSQAWLLNSMWCEWMDLKTINLSEISNIFLLFKSIHSHHIEFKSQA